MKKSLVCGLALVLSLPVFSQSSSTSPYSIYGIGDLETKGFASHTGMGDTKYAIIQTNVINQSNPASYSDIRYPTFQVGLAANFLELASSSATSNSNSVYLRNINFGIPLMKGKWGMSFGLTPYSKMGYEISAFDSIANIGEVEYQYQGEGGINQVYFGTAYRLYKDSANHHKISFGVNGSYLFGTVTQNKRTILQGAVTGFNSRISDNITISDVQLDAGVYYQTVLREIRDDENSVPRRIELTAAATYALENSLNASGNLFAVSYTGSENFENIRDTVVDSETNGSVVLPAAIGLGVSIDFYNKWLLALDYSRQDWTAYKAFGEDEPFGARDQLSFGAQFTPKLIGKIFETTHYRAGFRYGNSRLELGGEQLLEYGISFGLGVPILGSGSASSFNVSVEYGQRGNNNNELIRERFTNINFGLSFTPTSKFDRWFVKRRIE